MRDAERKGKGERERETERERESEGEEERGREIARQDLDSSALKFSFNCLKKQRAPEEGTVRLGLPQILEQSLNTTLPSQLCSFKTFFSSPSTFNLDQKVREKKKGRERGDSKDRTLLPKFAAVGKAEDMGSSSQLVHMDIYQLSLVSPCQ